MHGRSPIFFWGGGRALGLSQGLCFCVDSPADQIPCFMTGLIKSQLLFYLQNCFPAKGIASNYRLVVEGKDNSAMVHWFATGPEEDVTGYSLFYCQRQSFTRFRKVHLCDSNWNLWSDRALQDSRENNRT